MYNIGKYTWLKTDNFAENFFILNDETDLDNLSINDFSNLIVFSGGANILLKSDQYKEKNFVKNNLRGIEYQNGYFYVKAGENLSYFIKILNKKYNIHTFNPFFGLPGNIGGAVVGNAGSFGMQIGDFVKGVRYIDENKNEVYEENINFEYRNSSLKLRNIIVLEIILDIPHNSYESTQDIRYYLDRRHIHQEHKFTSGSFFKNTDLKKLSKKDTEKIIERLLSYKNFPKYSELDKINDMESFYISSGWLIENSGMKGYDIGGVKISYKHANFIYNYENTSGEKIYNLSQIIKEEVYNKFGILLEEEVRII